MRFLLMLLVALSFSGCVGDETNQYPTMASTCDEPELFRLYLTPDHRFSLEATNGTADGNGFVEGFLTNDMEEFRSSMDEILYNSVGYVQLEDHVRWVMDGNFSYQLAVETGVAVAPIVSTSEPTTGYHFFNQFGTSQGFTPGYDVFYADTVTTGQEYFYLGGWALPAGGYRIEGDDELRLLLTNLVLPDESAQNPRINTGSSWIEFTAYCEPMPTGLQQYQTSSAVDLPINQGLLTGAVPANEYNQIEIEYTPTTESKVQFTLTGPDDIPKDDVDMTFLYEGVEIWSGGSPYTDEVATIWRENFDALGIDGPITVQINGYSTIDYSGELVITAWT
jgi:hypothetical protein